LVAVALARRSCHLCEVTDEIVEIIHLDRNWRKPKAVLAEAAYCGAYGLPSSQFSLDLTAVTCVECARRQQAEAKVRSAMTPNVSVTVHR
jgi:hypothetical protein